MWYKIDKGFMWVREPNIPTEYQEVEYIQGSWTQYIDAWLAVKDWFKIICNTEFVSWGTYMCLWWYLWQSWWIYYRLYWWVSNTGKWAYWFLGNYSDDLGSSSLNTKYKLELHIKSWNNYFKVNDTTMASWTQTFSTSLTGNIWILAWYADDTSWKWNKWSAKMYDYKIRDNGWTLIRDFVPCYRKSDNVIWLYDLVNDQFYTNAWSWTFTKGNDVAPTYVFKEKQFYPGWWEPSVDWILFDETDYKNSVPSKNGKFHYVWWGNVSYWTNIWYDTTNWRVYSTSTHSLWATNINANSELVNAKKIKFVCDYLYCYNYNTYLSWTNFFPFTMQMNYNFSASLWDQTTSDPAIGSVVTHSTPYSAEFYYDLDSDSWTLLIKNLNTQAETELAIAWFKYTWDTNLSWWNLGFSIWMDQGRSSYMWDVHLYYSLT